MGEYIPLSPTSLRRAAELGLSVAWWAERYLPAPLRAEYGQQEAPIWAECERKVVQLWAEYRRQEAPLWAERQRREAQFRAEYEAQIAELCIRLLWPSQPPDPRNQAGT